MKVTAKTVFTILAVAVITIALIISRDQLTLENAQAALSDLEAFYTEDPIIFVAGFTIIYALMVLFYIPGPFLLNLIAGAVLGVYLGVTVTVVSVTIGSVLAFLASKYVLHDWVKGRFPKQAKTMDRAVKRSGAMYILMLRLAPALPVGLTNLLAGITAVRMPVFAAATLIGVVPWIAFYVVTGQQLANLKSLDNLVSTDMVLMICALMALIGIGHLAMKRINVADA